MNGKTGESRTHWRDLVETRLHEATLLREGRAGRIARERAIALDLSREEGLSPEGRMRLWRERTGRGGRAYWRRLREASAGPEVGGS